jgi:hypothetical protein
MTFAERIRSVTVSYANFVTKDKRNYYDTEKIAQTFGADAKEIMMEETKGIGAVQQGADGAFYKKGEQGPVRLTERETETILGRDREEAV